MLRCHPLLLRRISLAAVFGCATLSAACGQKGPLYRPDEKVQQVTPAADSSTPGPAGNSQTGKKKSAPVVPAPQSQKQDRENAQPTDTVAVPSASDPSATTDPATAHPATGPSQPPEAR